RGVSGSDPDRFNRSCALPACASSGELSGSRASGSGARGSGSNGTERSVQTGDRAEAPGPLPTVSASARGGSPAPLGSPPSPDSQGLAGQYLRTGIHHGPERRATAPSATRRSLLRAGTGGPSK